MKIIRFNKNMIVLSKNWINIVWKKKFLTSQLSRLKKWVSKIKLKVRKQVTLNQIKIDFMKNSKLKSKKLKNKNNKYGKKKLSWSSIKMK